MNNEDYTSLVINASTIATTGGTNAQNVAVKVNVPAFAELAAKSGSVIMDNSKKTPIFFIKISFLELDSAH